MAYIPKQVLELDHCYADLPYSRPSDVGYPSASKDQQKCTAGPKRPKPSTTAKRQQEVSSGLGLTQILKTKLGC